MLQINNFVKEYRSGDLVQKALDDVSLTLRDSEFVAILGPSGSGKTTLLNVIGGLDHADSGELVINKISTKNYRDKDWDSYRNHTIGFVFQSYYLIPHQSVLKNVELSLTIAGVSKAERKKRALEALAKVGLEEHSHKRPSQLSGGQMQRVAIARALINNPSVVLADEPTGALDSETSVQIMNLLKEIAKEKLVVMVTHNPELAQEYATRIIKLHDGKIVDDSNPFDAKDANEEKKYENMGKTKMSLLTSLSLSFNNLRSKKGRTILTAFAGSIGIIGIAMILSISSGVNRYIEDIQKSTMSSYPITIQQNAIDISSFFAVEAQSQANQDVGHELDAVYSNNAEIEEMTNMSSATTTNNMEAFKDYLDDENSEIHNFVGQNGIAYTYDTAFDLYTYDPNEVFVNTDGSFSGSNNQTISMGGMDFTRSSSSNEYVSEMLPGTDGNLVGQSVMDSYDLAYGEWPTEYNEVVLVLNGSHEIPVSSLCYLGFLPEEDLVEILDVMGNAMSSESADAFEIDQQVFSYEDVCNKVYYIMPEAMQYVDDGNGGFQYIGDDRYALEGISNEMIPIRISGIIVPREDAENAILVTPIAYTSALTQEIINRTNTSAVVEAQEANPDTNVVNGLSFSPADDATKAEDARAYIENMSDSERADFFIQMLQVSGMMDEASMEQYTSMSDSELATMCLQMLDMMEESDLVQIYDGFISTGSYDENMMAFGVVDLNSPSSINIYTDSFENKDEVARCIADYNASAEDADKIVYTDYVALIMSSVTTIVNVISYVLIAFVAVSLVVSSIMIGIITYISVLERTKEIGILRAIGASKRNISQVFNAETFIIGLLSGLFGVGLTLLMLIPSNAIIHAVADTDIVSAYLPIPSAIVLVVLSVILTLIGGFIPSKKAARKDPVEALRTE